MTLEQSLQKAQSQGATHMHTNGTGVIRVYRHRGNRWQGNTLYEHNDGTWQYFGMWKDLSFPLPHNTQLIPK